MYFCGNLSQFLQHLATKSIANPPLSLDEMQVHRRMPIRIFSNFSHISGNLFINPGGERHCEEKGVPSPEKRKKQNTTQYTDLVSNTVPSIRNPAR